MRAGSPPAKSRNLNGLTRSCPTRQVLHGKDTARMYRSALDAVGLSRRQVRQHRTDTFKLDRFNQNPAIVRGDGIIKLAHFNCASSSSGPSGKCPTFRHAYPTKSENSI